MKFLPRVELNICQYFLINILHTAFQEHEFHPLIEIPLELVISCPADNERGPNEPVWLSGEPDYFGRNKILSGYDLSHYQVPHCIRVFFYFVWFVFIHHNFQFYFKLCTYCNILDIYLS